MAELLFLPKDFWNNIVPAGHSQQKIMVSAIVIASLCAVCTISFGLYSAIPIILFLFLYLIFNEWLSLLHILLIFTPIFQWKFLSLSNAFIYPLAFLMVFLWLIRKMILKQELIYISDTLIAYIIVFFGVAVISGLNGGLTPMELKSFIRFIIFFAIVLMIYDYLKPKNMMALIYSITIPLIVSSFVIIYTYMQRGSFLELIALFRFKPAGIFHNANSMGAMIVLVLPIWISMAIWARRMPMKITSLVFSVILTVGLVLTNSRASFIGLFLATLLISFWMKKLKFLLMLGVIFFIILFSMPVARNIVSAALRVEEGTQRETIWANSMDMLEKNFVLGVGLGNFSSEYDQYFETAWEHGFVGFLPNAHNQLLALATELGISGLFLVLFLYYFSLKCGIKALKRTKSIEDKAVIYGIIASLVALFGRGMFEAGGIFSGGRLYGDIIFWIFLIVLMKISEFREEIPRGLFFKPYYNSVK